MRSLFLIAIVASAAFMAGWFTISRDDEHTTIKFNRDEIRKDAKTALDRGRQILNKQGQPAAESVDVQYTARQSQFEQPAPSQYRPDSSSYSRDPSPWQQPSPSYPQDRASFQDRTVSNPPADWNQQQTPYRPASARRPQPTQWQQPPGYSEGPATRQPRGYDVPRPY